MPHPNLQQLHRKTVAIQLAIHETARLLKGRCLYEPDSELGPILRILVEDPAGEFELLVKEQQWTGQIASGERFGCDYAIQLDASSPCLK